MRAVRLFAPGDVRCVEVDKPTADDPRDVIIRVKACGVCGSDIMRVMEKGAYRYPITIGHEFAGVVESVGGGVDDIAPGDRVTIMPLIPCGRCDYCRIGQYVLCDDYQYYGSRIDGAMAEYIRVTADNVLKLPEGVDWEAGAMTDPVSVALHAVRKTGLEAGQSVAVLGLGAIGLLTVQWLRKRAAGTIFAVDVYPEKLELARDLGADIAIDGRETDAVEAILEKTAGEGVDAVIELAGNKVTQVQAIQAARKMGTVVYCGISYDDLTIPNKALSRILRGELNLRGAWNSSIAPLPINEWIVSLEELGRGQFVTDRIVSHRFPLERCQDCFNMMYGRTEVFNKVMFLPEKTP